ncbi:MAG TPA: ParB/RepB/Spo0J family partition protein [Trueperaceae bacterium]
MAKKRGSVDRSAVFEAILGGLAEEEAVESGATLPLRAIRFNDRQPRKHISEEGLAELAASIRDKGVIEPVIVRRMGGGFELVAGERRTRAAALAGLDEIPAIVVDIDDREALEIAIIENLQREDLNAVEETEAVLGLLEMELDAGRREVTQVLQTLYNEERGRITGRKVSDGERRKVQAVFKRLGRFGISSFVSNRLPILEFPESLLAAVREGKLAFTKAQAIARVNDPDDRERLLSVAMSEDLSLSQIRRRITELRAGRAALAQRGAGSHLDATQRLVSSTKRLLNKRRLVALPPEKLSRVNDLLEALRAELEE